VLCYDAIKENWVIVWQISCHWPWIASQTLTSADRWCFGGQLWVLDSDSNFVYTTETIIWRVMMLLLKVN